MSKFGNEKRDVPIWVTWSIILKIVVLRQQKCFRKLQNRGAYNFIILKVTFGNLEIIFNLVMLLLITIKLPSKAMFILKRSICFILYIFNDQINSAEVRLIKWNFSPIGAYKINTHGSVRQWKWGSYRGLDHKNIFMNIFYEYFMRKL